MPDEGISNVSLVLPVPSSSASWSGLGGGFVVTEGTGGVDWLDSLGESEGLSWRDLATILSQLATFSIFCKELELGVRNCP